MEALISCITAEGPAAKRPPHCMLASAVAEVGRVAHERRSPGDVWHAAGDAAPRAGSCGAAAGGTLAVAWRLGKPRGADCRCAGGRPGGRGAAARHRRTEAPPIRRPRCRRPRWSMPTARAHGVAEFAGKGLVINLWATWCVPCVAELPALAALAARLRRTGILVLPASSDRGGAPVVVTFYRRARHRGLAGLARPEGRGGAGLGRAGHSDHADRRSPGARARPAGGRGGLGERGGGGGGPAAGGVAGRGARPWRILRP